MKVGLGPGGIGVVDDGVEEVEAVLNKAPLEILRIIEQQRKKESMQWRQRESRAYETTTQELNHERHLSHQLRGDITQLESKLRTALEVRHTHLLFMCKCCLYLFAALL